MATLDTTKKRISNFVVDSSSRMLKMGAVVIGTVKNTATVSVDCLGLPVIVDGSGDWEFFKNTDDIATVTAVAGVKVGIIVGSNEGYGRNEEPTVFNSAGAKCHIMVGLFGTPIVKTASIDWSVLDVDGNAAVTPADAGEQSEFITQLKVQGIADQAVAVTVDPTFVL